MNYPQTIDIDYDELGQAEYDYKKGKKYKYIDVGTLDQDAKDKIIELLDKKNGMPNNFLKFLYDTDLDKIKNIFKQQKNSENDNKIESQYSPRFDQKEDYVSHKFGIILKVDVENKDEKQLVFYCSKNQALYEQFFLEKALVTEKYNQENLEFSLSDIKGSQNSQSKNSSKNEKETFKSREDFKDEMDVDKYFRGHILESEVINYLRNRIGIYEGKNNELPTVFYAIKDKKFFYNEFDSIFMLDNEIKLNENIVRVNCKYESGLFENSKKVNKNSLEIKGKNVVFVECKSSGDFGNIFLKLFKKIYRFRSLLDNIFDIKDYGTKILYLYDTKFLERNVCFERFCSAVQNAISICSEENKYDVKNYDVLAFYINSNVHLYNYESIEKELKNVKIQQEKEKIQQKKELENVKIQQEIDRMNFQSQIEYLIGEINRMKGLQDNNTAKKDQANGYNCLKQISISLNIPSNKYEKVNDNKKANDNIFHNSDEQEKYSKDNDIMKDVKNN